MILAALVPFFGDEEAAFLAHLLVFEALVELDLFVQVFHVAERLKVLGAAADFVLLGAQVDELLGFLVGEKAGGVGI